MTNLENTQQVILEILVPALEGTLSLSKETIAALKETIRQASANDNKAKLLNGNLRTCVNSLFTGLHTIEGKPVIDPKNTTRVNPFNPFLVYTGFPNSTIEVTMAYSVNQVLSFDDDCVVTVVWEGKVSETHYFYFTVKQLREYVDFGILPLKEPFRSVVYSKN